MASSVLCHSSHEIKCALVEIGGKILFGSYCFQEITYVLENLGLDFSPVSNIFSLLVYDH